MRAVLLPQAQDDEAAYKQFRQECFGCHGDTDELFFYNGASTIRFRFAKNCVIAEALLPADSARPVEKCPANGLPALLGSLAHSLSLVSSSEL